MNLEHLTDTEIWLTNNIYMYMYTTIFIYHYLYSRHDVMYLHVHVLCIHCTYDTLSRSGIVHSLRPSHRTNSPDSGAKCSFLLHSTEINKEEHIHVYQCKYVHVYGKRKGGEVFLQSFKTMFVHSIILQFFSLKNCTYMYTHANQVNHDISPLTTPSHAVCDLTYQYHTSIYTWTE